jgi:hypothetical protein
MQIVCLIVGSIRLTCVTAHIKIPADNKILVRIYSNHNSTSLCPITEEGKYLFVPRGTIPAGAMGPADNNGICSIRMGKGLERVPGLILANIFYWEYKTGMPHTHYRQSIKYIYTICIGK